MEIYFQKSIKNFAEIYPPTDLPTTRLRVEESLLDDRYLCGSPPQEATPPQEARNAISVHACLLLGFSLTEEEVAPTISGLRNDDEDDVVFHTRRVAQNHQTTRKKSENRPPSAAYPQG
jgi:hypothetical protein